MITPDMIPDEVVKAARDAWDGYYNFHKSLAAALNAWPGVEKPMWSNLDPKMEDEITLPVTKRKVMKNSQAHNLHITPIQKGCICPPQSEQTCQNPQCGRKPDVSASDLAKFRVVQIFKKEDE